MNLSGTAVMKCHKFFKIPTENIMVFHDYEAGVEYAKKVNKPIMLDFTGWACVNCRKMEEQVWSDDEVKKMLADDLVLISLYVDERTKLPVDQQYEKYAWNKVE